MRHRKRLCMSPIASNRHWRPLLAIITAVIWAFAGGPDADSAAPPVKPTEYQVKAAYLYNFGKFIHWPDAGKNESFAICVLGRDPFGSVLDETLANEHIDGQKVTALRLTRAQEAASSCRIVFIGSSESGRLNEILPTLGKGNVLTVADMPQFTMRGGMIQFILQGDRVRFEVNLAAAQRAGLSLSSELLKVATSVRTTPGKESE